jgi:hypothetical protein
MGHGIPFSPVERSIVKTIAIGEYILVFTKNSISARIKSG